MSKAATFEVSESGEEVRLRLFGNWCVDGLQAADRQARAYTVPDGRSVVVDLSEVGMVDTAGAWVIYRLHRRLSREHPSQIVGMDDDTRILLEVVAEHEKHVKDLPPPQPPLYAMLERTGQGVERNFFDLINSIGFFGLVLAVARRTLFNPKRFRLTSFVHHMEHDGFDAVTIVFTISFLVGAVVAYMGGELLREFGAEVLTIDLIAFSVLREFGVLLTAIMIAGRSGSAFTAQIGSMKAHEEIDAMRTLGLDPIELLVLPRVLALVISMPILTFIADVSGIFGGAMISLFVLDLSPNMFVETIRDEIELRHFLTGLVKAPVFALLIAVIGCYQGLRVEGTAESIGTHTTTSVVQAIFAVIVADALFAMFFQEIGF